MKQVLFVVFAFILACDSSSGVQDTGVGTQADVLGADVAPDVPPGEESGPADVLGEPPDELLADPGLDPVADTVPEPGLDPGIESAEDPMPEPGPDLPPEPGTEVGPDVPCEPPAFPDDCSKVSEFQCGFSAECKGGTLLADWHHHWFCEGEEQITDFSCQFKCPHGCTEGEITEWPANGKEFVEQFCNQCEVPEDCEGLPHVECVGYWTCDDGDCVWKCGEPCVEEGGSVPVVPSAPDCCEGLVKVPCDKPDEQGICQLCVGASICTRCGDGQCGKGENPCNCPEDCTSGCLGLGGTFLDFQTEGKCCPGLKPVPDCEIGEGDGCICKKCPCYICVPCGDGECGPFEHLCNCPEDCPTAEKCVPTKRSECKGGDPYSSPPEGKLKLEVGPNSVTIYHTEVVLNCCFGTTVCFTPKAGLLEVVEHKGDGPGCFCNCLFDIEATLDGLKPGTYTLTLFNEEQNKTLFTESIEIP